MFFFMGGYVKINMVYWVVSDDSDLRTLGPLVSLDIRISDPCLALTIDRCLNGGTCIPLGTSYTCKCRPGYEGDVCSIGKLFFHIYISFSPKSNPRVIFNAIKYRYMYFSF